MQGKVIPSSHAAHRGLLANAGGLAEHKVKYHNGAPAAHIRELVSETLWQGGYAKPKWGLQYEAHATEVASTLSLL